MYLSSEYQIVKKKGYYEITKGDATWTSHTLSDEEYQLWLVFQKFASRFNKEETKELQYAIENFGQKQYKEGNDSGMFRWSE